MNLRTTVLALLLPALLSGCFTTNSTPEWVNNPKAVYAEADYLVAVGAGDTRRAAENAASANLSRIFESQIKSVEHLNEQTLETTDRFERTTDLTTDINILSAQTLVNIQHAEAWKDNAARYHAVAYLDRRETAAIYRSRISEQGARVHFLMAQAEQAGDLLKKYAALRAANRTAAEVSRMLSQLKVIHPRSVPDSTPGYSIHNLQNTLADTAKQIKVSIAVSGDERNRLAACIEELITRYGFVAGKPAVLNLEADVSITDTDQRTADLVFVRYQMTLQVKDTRGTVLIATSENGREGHMSPNEARIRAFRTLENAIKAGGAQQLDAYFDSLIEQH